MFKATYSRTRVREYSKSNELLKTYLILYVIIAVNNNEIFRRNGAKC